MEVEKCWLPRTDGDIHIQQCVRACLVMSDSLQPHQAPLSRGFSRQEYWSGLPFPPPGGLPDPGIEPMSPALAGRFFTTEPHGKPMNVYEPLLKPWSILLLYTWTSLVNDNLAITCVFSKGNDPVFEPFVYTVFHHRKHNASRFVYKQDLYQRHPQ